MDHSDGESSSKQTMEISIPLSLMALVFREGVMTRFKSTSLFMGLLSRKFRSFPPTPIREFLRCRPFLPSPVPTISGEHSLSRSKEKPRARCDGMSKPLSFFSWNANPWVAAYTFDVIRQNVDQIEEAD